jgi:hypothetical protein
MTVFDALSPLFHPLQSDDDAPTEDLMAARVRAAHAWGQLQGRLAHAPPTVVHHFCCALTRHLLVDALAQSGFADVKSWFCAWFSGLEAVPGVTAHATASAALVAQTLLSELSLSPCEPLSEAAAQIRAAAKFDRDDTDDQPTYPPARVIEDAVRLADTLDAASGEEWPLAVLESLHSLAAKSPQFAPVERGRQILALRSGPLALEQTMPSLPLWALDLVVGPVLARRQPGVRPLPFPGAFRGEALRPELWPRERAILIAEAAHLAAERLTLLLDQAHATVRGMAEPMSGLRSTSRAPLLYRLLSGFGPLRPIQIEKALSASKNGVRDLIAALTKAGLVTMTSQQHQMVVTAHAPGHAPNDGPLPGQAEEPIPETNFAAFDAAMADIDRLLARSDGLNPIQ